MIAVLFLAIVGIGDTSYLTYEHYSKSLPPCSVSIWVDCGKVLTSKYSMIGPIPVSVLGLAFYSTMLGLMIVRFSIEKQLTIKEVLWKILERYARPRSLSLEKMLFYAQFFFVTSAALFSAYFVYLQIGVLHAICLYCMFSAVFSFTMFVVTLTEYFKVQRQSL